MNSQKYPDNPTGNVLAKLKELGSNMNIAMEIDFSIDCPSQDACANVLRRLSGFEERSEILYDEASKVWYCEIKVNLIPTYDNIVEIENILTSHCRNTNCKYTGFGSLGNATS